MPATGTAPTAVDWPLATNQRPQPGTRWPWAYGRPRGDGQEPPLRTWVTGGAQPSVALLSVVLPLYTTSSSTLTYNWVVQPAAAERPRPPSAAGRARPVLSVAEDRAEALLRSALSPAQLAEYVERRRFHVVTPSGRRLRVEWGEVANVVELDAAGRDRAAYCAHPRERVPTADVLVAQKLFLEHDEEGFFRVANTHRLRAG